MALFIIVSIIATLIAIAAYQVVIHKYYRGPKGPPKKPDQNKDSRQK